MGIQFNSKSLKTDIARRISIASLGLLVITTSRASAQDRGFDTPVELLDTLVSATPLPSGELELVFEDGRIEIIAAKDFVAQEGTFYLADTILAELIAEPAIAEAASSEGGIGLLPGAAGAILIGAGASATGVGGSGDDNNPPTITSPNTVYVPEAQIQAYTVVAQDPDGDILTYSISGGPDANLFTIDPQSGEISFLSPPDFEAPAGAIPNNQYQINVSASDGSATSTQTVIITVSDVDDTPPPEPENIAPSITSDADIPSLENIDEAFVVTATDPENDTLTYAIVGGADADLFTIDAVTGVVQFVNTPDFEAPSDDNGDNVYDIEVSVTDGQLTTTQTISLTVTDVDENSAPEFIGSDGIFIIDEISELDLNQFVTDADEDALSLSLSGPDADLFSLTDGRLNYTGPELSETAPDLNVTLTIDDGQGGSVDQTLSITVLDFNRAPIIDGEATIMVVEGASLDISDRFRDTDNDTLTLSLSGRDADDFTLENGQLRYAGSDLTQTSTFNLILSADDGATSLSQEVIVIVTAVDTIAPVFAEGDSRTLSVAENTTGALFTINSNDVDSAPLSYAIATGQDSDLFAIDPASGVVTLADGQNLDFQTPGDGDTDNSYTFRITATDTAGNTAEQSITLTVTDVDENTAPVFDGVATFTVFENETAVATLSATDNEDDILSYAITGGADADLFTIDATTGLVEFITAPDFETPGDADGDNIYDIEVSVSDDTMSAIQSITVRVTDVDDGVALPPSGSTFIGTDVADAFTGTDGNDAFLNISTADSISAVDGNDTIEITDTDFEFIDGGAGTDTLALVGTDITLDLSDDAYADRLSSLEIIDLGDGSNSLILDRFSVLDILNLERTSSEVGVLTIRNDDSRDVELIGAWITDQVTDADGFITYINANSTVRILESISVTLTNTPPEITDPQAGFTLSPTNTQTFYTPNVANSDRDILTFTIEFAAETERPLPVIIDPATGALRLESDYDFADAGQFELVLIVADNVSETRMPITLTIDAGAPTITLSDTLSISESDTATVLASIQDSVAAISDLAIDISGVGADLFTITETGDLVFSPEADFALTATTDYDLTLSVTDTVGNTTTQTVTITVEPANTPPEFTSAATFNVAENETVVGTITANDAENNELAYTITGGADADLFQLDPTSGALSFITAPDFETPNDQDRTNTYEIQVTANDGRATASQDIIIEVSDVTEVSPPPPPPPPPPPDTTAPIFTSPDEQSVAENTTGALFTVRATDASDITYAIVDFSNLFEIDASSGAVTLATGIELDFEAGINSYNFTVTATDAAGNIAEQVITLTVTDVNEAPVFNFLSNDISLGQNDTLDLTAFVEDPEGDNLIFFLEGANSFDFSILSNQLIFAAPLPENDPYSITLIASDVVGNIATQAITVTVTAVDTTAPVFADGGSRSVEVAENTTGTLFTISATDTSVVTYAIIYDVENDDSGLFTIDAISGDVTLVDGVELDFETGPSNYSFTVVATDAAANFATQTITLTVTNVNDNSPVITSAPDENGYTLTEADTDTFYTLTANDADGDPLTYSVTSPNDTAVPFNIDTDGSLTYTGTDELSADADFNLTLTVSDGELSASQDIAVTVTNVNRAPVFDVTGDISFGENSLFDLASVVSDPDGNDIAVTLSGDDSDNFALSNGRLTYTGPELLRDADAYETPLTLTASDGAFSVDQEFNIIITEANAPPIIEINDPPFAVNQDDRNPILNLNARDPDGDPLTYTVTDLSNEPVPFTLIDGDLTYIGTDELPSNSPYFINVVAADDRDSFVSAETIVVVSPGPVLDGGPFRTVEVAENSTDTLFSVSAAISTDAGPVTYALVDANDAVDFDNHLFRVDETTGEITLADSFALDFEALPDRGAENAFGDYAILVSATDGNGRSTNDDPVSPLNQVIYINVTDVNDAPVITSNPIENGYNISEEDDGSTPIYRLTARDDDNDELSYGVTDANGNSVPFAIDTEGNLTYTGSEELSADTVFDLILTVSDDNLTATQEITVTVTNEDDIPPVFADGDSRTVEVAENTTGTLFTVSASDTSDITYAIVDTGADDDRDLFAMDADGNVTLANGVELDFEIPGDRNSDNTYSFTVSATDAAGNSAEQAINLTVTDVLENTAPIITSTNAFTVAENATAVGTVIASDSNGDELSYSISDGADGSLFSIDAETGALSFINAPNFEAPDDTGSNNVYDIQVSVSDDTDTTSQDIQITVTNVDEPFAFTTVFDDGIIIIPENDLGERTVRAVDPDYNSNDVTVQYTLSGDDASAFAYQNGLLFLQGRADFENPLDANGDNTYEITLIANLVNATNGTPIETVTQDVAVVVTDENERPVILPVYFEPIEETDEATPLVTFSDPEGDPIDFSLTWTDNTSTGEVPFRVNDFGELIYNRSIADNIPTGDTRTYSFDLTATDATNVFTRSFEIQVQGVNEAPEFADATANVEVDADTDGPIYTPSDVTDPEGDAPIFSLSASDGAGLFVVDPATGAISIAQGANFELEVGESRDYTLTLQATDPDNDALFDQQTVAITVIGVDTLAPAFTSPDTQSVAENTTGTLFTVSATDTSDITYAIVNTVEEDDSGLFAMDADGNVTLATGVELDFEALPNGVNGDNTYSFTVSATDATGNSAEQAITLAVTDVNEAPVFDNVPATNLSTESNASGAIADISQYTSDPDAGDTLTYTLLSVTLDDTIQNGLFVLTSAGALSLNNDAEFQLADGDTQTYTLTLQVTDASGLSNTQDIQVAVTGAVDNMRPVIVNKTVTDEDSFAIDRDDNTILATISDDNTPINNLTIEFLADNGDPLNEPIPFTVNESGQLVYDDSGLNITDTEQDYNFTLRVTDGNDAISEADFAITVMPVAAPVIDLVALTLDQGFALSGAAAGDFAGSSLSFAGDIDGDGYGDMLIGAAGVGGDDINTNNVGAAYLIYGGQGLGDIDLGNLGPRGVTFNGAAPLDRAGASVSSAGDVNGDGYGDMLIGAPGVDGDDGNTNNIGAAYLIYGGEGLGNIDLNNLGDQGVTLSGGERNVFPEISVSAAGDINGDGFADMLIGITGIDNDTGKAYLIYGGQALGDITLNALDPSQGITLNGAAAGDLAGTSVSPAGDINGDGYGDILIGASGADEDAGAAYLIYGGQALGDIDLGNVGDQGITLSGGASGNRVGISVSHVGDINGDGYGDILIGASGVDGNTGAAYLIFGGPALGDIDLGNVGDQGITFSGGASGNRVGGSVSSAGDVNGDGYEDLLISARADNGSIDAAYLIYGGQNVDDIDLSSLSASQGLVFTAPTITGFGANRVSAAGDVNDDGYADVLIGVPSANSDTGAAFVIYGGPIGVDATDPLTLAGTAEADSLIGNAGPDMIGQVGSNDIVRGGAGDDTITLSATDFADIDGGTGIDTLVFGDDLNAVSLDLTDAVNRSGLTNIDIIDLGAGNNTLTLNALAVLGITGNEATDDGITTLRIDGTDGTVQFSDASWVTSDADDDTGYITYINGAVAVQIASGVGINRAPYLSEELALIEVNENTTERIEVFRAGIDPDGEPILPLFSGLEEYVNFDFSSSDGGLTFTVTWGGEAQLPLDFETLRTTSDFSVITGDGRNYVEVTADTLPRILDLFSGLPLASDSVPLTLRIYDVDEAPVFADATASVAADSDASGAIYTPSDVTDPEGEAPIFSLSASNGAGLFVVDAGTGTISIAQGANFNLEVGETRDYTLTLQATDPDDDTLFAEQTVTIAVTGVALDFQITGYSQLQNEQWSDVSPIDGEIQVFENSETTFQILTNAPEGANVTFLTFMEDGDGQSTVGDEAFVDFNAFGYLLLNADFETPQDQESNNTYIVTVVANLLSDSDDPGSISIIATAEQEITLQLVNVNEAPVFDDDTSESTTISADINSNQVIYDFDAVHPVSGQSPIYSIEDGNEAGVFEIDSDSGVLTTSGNGTIVAGTTYTLTIRASDIGGESTDHTFTITVESDDTLPTPGPGIAAPDNAAPTGITLDVVEPVTLNLGDAIEGDGKTTLTPAEFMLPPLGSFDIPALDVPLGFDPMIADSQTAFGLFDTDTLLP